AEGGRAAGACRGGAGRGAAWAAADVRHGGLALRADRGRPARAARGPAGLAAGRAARARRFLKAFQLAQRREQRPGAAFAHADVADAAAGASLEREEEAVARGRWTRQLPQGG